MRYYRFANNPHRYPNVNYSGTGRRSYRSAEARELADYDRESYFLPGRGSPEPLDPDMLPPWQSVSGIMPELSDNEKRLVTIGVLGMVGWFFFGEKIKKRMKK